MASKTKAELNGVSSGFLLFLTFLVLKLTGVITWSWWWVTAPLWGGLLIALVVTLVVLVVMSIIHLFKQ